METKNKRAFTLVQILVVVAVVAVIAVLVAVGIPQNREAEDQVGGQNQRGIDQERDAAVDPDTTTIRVTPDSQDFGSVAVNTNTERNFTVTNAGRETLSGAASVVAPFSCVAGCTYNIPAGASHTVTIRFTPTGLGQLRESVKFSGGEGRYGFVSGAGLMAHRRAFITSTTHSGNLGGLAGADAICQSRANAAGLGGTWKAWLSDNYTSARDRLTHHTVPIYRVDRATRIANSWPVSGDGVLMRWILTTEYNEDSAEDYTWTGTTDLGEIYEDRTCNGWTTHSHDFWGRVGQVRVPWPWTHALPWSSYSSNLCSSRNPLICIEQ